ncbi:hypothetical protein U1Q18_024406 [Sarracenia purpurea var. burkii]
MLPWFSQPATQEWFLEQPGFAGVWFIKFAVAVKFLHQFVVLLHLGVVAGCILPLSCNSDPLLWFGVAAGFSKRASVFQFVAG